MKKWSCLFLLIPVLLLDPKIIHPAPPGDPMYFRGEYNGWQAALMLPDLTAYSWHFLVDISTTDSSFEYKFDPSGNWTGNNYGQAEAGKITANNQVSTAAYNSGLNNLASNINTANSCWLISLSTSSNVLNSTATYSISLLENIALSGQGFISPVITWTPSDLINKMTQDPYDYKIWYKDVQLREYSQAQFKFAPNSSWYSPAGTGWSFGDTDGAPGPDRITGTAYPGGSRANLTYTPLRTGGYRIKLNVMTGEYWIIFIDELTESQESGAESGILQGKIIQDAYPDKSRYSPGDNVNISVELQNTLSSPVSGALVFSLQNINREVLSSSSVISLAPGEGLDRTVSFTAPGTDFTGYIVTLRIVDSAGSLTDQRNTAIDVSSDWVRYPRMGVFCDFDGSETEESISSKVRTFTKYHINNVYFYDWMWRHETLIKKTGTEPDPSYVDLFYRTLSTATLSRKIGLLSEKNIVSNAYHLPYGARESYEDYGCSITWGLFSAAVPSIATQRKHEFEDLGHTVYLMDLSNSNWNGRMMEEYAGALNTFGFDGFVFDQLGPQSPAYNYSGATVDVPATLAQFINNTRAVLTSINPQGKITCNTVVGTAESEVASSNADYMYRELWSFSGENNYNGLRDKIDGLRASGKPVVVSAYMNYDFAKTAPAPENSYFSEPSIILTNACIWASGAQYLELAEGEELLSNEYYPTRTLKVSSSLKNKLRKYYDFNTAYQNLLFDGNISGISQSYTIKGVEAASGGDGGKVYVLMKRKTSGDWEMLQIMNLYNNDNDWRNLANTPPVFKNLTIKYYPQSGFLSNLFFASPDYETINPVYVPYTRGTDGGGTYIECKIPALEYWTALFLQTVVDTVSPAAISDLSAGSGTGQGEVRLTWTAPGDDGTTGGLSGGIFSIRYSSVSQITDFSSPPSPYYELNISTAFMPLSKHSAAVTGLVQEATYYFAIRTADESLNWSSWNAAANPGNFYYAGGFRRIIDGNPGDWLSITLSTPNAAAVSGSEWAWRDKYNDRRSSGSAPADDFDLTQVRFTFDSNYLYGLVKFQTLSDTGRVHIAISLDTDNLPSYGMLWTGDDTTASGTLGIGDGYGYYQPAAEKNMLIHNTGEPGFDTQVEIYPDPSDGIGWGAPAGSWQAAISTTYASLEFRIPRADLGINAACRFRWTLISCENNTDNFGAPPYNWAGAADTTRPAKPQSYGPDALDTVGIMRINENDPEYQKTSMEEELSDNDIDFWVSLSIASDGNITNSAPSAPVPLYPAGEESVTSAHPEFYWAAALDPDAGDAVTGYLIEISSAGTDFTGPVSFRINTQDNRWDSGYNLIQGTTYYWRVSARDRSGVLTVSTATYRFCLNPYSVFTPVIDGIKENPWNNALKITSNRYRDPGNFAKNCYITNDAAYLYAGFEALGDAWNDYKVSQYGFIFDCNASTAGINYDPLKTTTQIGWDAKPDIWVSGSADWGGGSFGSLSKYAALNSSWTLSALSEGSDWKVALNSGWGEFRIPLQPSALYAGSTVHFLYVFRPASDKPGVSDSTPFDTNTNYNGDTNSVLVSSAIYIIRPALLRILHKPETMPYTGWDLMRSPLSPSSAEQARITAGFYPDGIFQQGSVIYSTNNWTTSNTVIFTTAAATSGAEYREARLPGRPGGTTVKYYIKAGVNNMTSYAAGPGNSDSELTFSEVTAQSLAWSYQTTNSSPVFASAALTPLIPSNSADIICSINCYDPDGEGLVYRYYWYRNDAFFSTEELSATVSTIPYTSTNAGEDWYCIVFASDTAGNISGIYSNQVKITGRSWQAAPPGMINQSTSTVNEFIWQDRENDPVVPSRTNADIKEVRLSADTTYLYILFKMSDITSIDLPYLAVCIDTDSISGTGNQEIGDDSGLGAGAGYPETAGNPGYQASWEKQLIFHSVAAGDFACELSTAPGAWSRLASGTVYCSEKSDLIEAILPRAELGLDNDRTIRVSIAAFENSIGSAAVSDTTVDLSFPGDCLDTVSIVRLSTGSSAGAFHNDRYLSFTASFEELSDIDLDFWFQLRLATGSVSVNAAPPAPYNFSPADGLGINSANPALTWNQAQDPDDAVTSWFLELNSENRFSSDVLYRLNVSTNSFTVSENLITGATYFWRAGARDRAGQVTLSTSVYSFCVNIIPPEIIGIYDDKSQDNLNMYGLVTGVEDKDGTITFEWLSTGSGLSGYELLVSTDPAFGYYSSSAALTASSFTATGLSKGWTHYAGVRAINSAGEYSPRRISDGIYVNQVAVDGDISDWAPVPSTGTNLLLLSDHTVFWLDAAGDRRQDRTSSSQLDISTFCLTSDLYNLYFYIGFNSTTTVPSFDSRNWIQIAVDNATGSPERVFRGRDNKYQDSYVSAGAAWEYLVEIIPSSGLVRAVDNNFKTAGYGLYSGNPAGFYYEAAVPVSILGGRERFINGEVNFTAGMFWNDGGQIGQWDISGNNSNLVDVLSSTATWEEVQDQVVDFYLEVGFSGELRPVTALAVNPAYSAPPAEPEPPSNGVPPPASSFLDYILYNIFIDAWHNGNPANDDLNDLNDFGGDFQGVIDKAGYLNEMGINCAYFGPPTEFDGGIWGFNISDAYNHETKFGGTQKYIELVKTLHNRNIKVMIDWVCGQLGSVNSVTAKKHPQYFRKEQFGWGTRQEFAEARAFWINNLLWYFSLCDAVRYDNPKFWNNTDPEWGFGFEAYDFNRALRRLTDRLDPSVYLMGEIPEDAGAINEFTGTNGPMLHGGLDMRSGGYKNNRSAYICSWVRAGADKKTTEDARNGIMDQQKNLKNEWSINPVMLENHDEVRFISRWRSDDGAGWEWDQQAGYIAAITVAGPVDIMYGGEVGMEGPWSGSGGDLKMGRTGNVREMDFNRANQSPWNTVRANIRKAIQAKANFQCLRGEPYMGGLSFYTGGQYDGDVLVFVREGWGQKIIIMINRATGDVPLSPVATGDANTTYKDWLTDSSFATDGTGDIASVTVTGHNARILIRGGYDWGNVTGYVRYNGLPVADAIVDIDQKSHWTGTTDDTGYYSFSGDLKKVLFGNHTIRAWAEGYEISEQSINITVVDNSIDFALVKDNTPPAAPRGLTAKARDQAALLAWQSNTENDLQSYLVYRSGSPIPDGSFPEPVYELFKPYYYDCNLDGKLDSNDNVYDLLENGSPYYYRVRAVDRNNNKSAFSDQVTVVPKKVKVTFWLDTRDSGIAVATACIAGGALTFHTTYWEQAPLTAAGDGTFYRTFEFDETVFLEYKYVLNNSIWEGSAALGTPFLDGSAGEARRGEMTDNAVPDIEITDEGDGTMLRADKWRYYNDQAPRSPTGLSVIPGADRLFISWTQSPEKDLKNYNIYRSSWSSAAGFSLIYSPDKNMNLYIDGNLLSGNTCYYKMTAVDRNIKTSAYSDPVSGFSGTVDTQAPAAPQNPAVFYLAEDSLLISWNPNAEKDLAGYDIFRSTYGFPAGYGRINTGTILPSSAPFYADYRLSPGLTYYYALRAKDIFSNYSALSSSVAAHFTEVTFSVDMGNINPGTVKLGGDTLPLKWNPEADFALARQGNTATWKKTLKMISGTRLQYKYSYNSAQWEDNFNTPSGNREFTVPFQSETRDDDWEESPAAPTGIYSRRSSGTITVNWTGNSSAEDLAGYNIYGSTETEREGFARLNSALISAGPRIITGLDNGATYYFIVRSADSGDKTYEGADSELHTSWPVEMVLVRAVFGCPYTALGNSPWCDSSRIKLKIAVQTGTEIPVWESADRADITSGLKEMTSDLASWKTPVQLYRGFDYNFIFFAETTSTPPQGLSANTKYFDTVPSRGSFYTSTDTSSGPELHSGSFTSVLSNARRKLAVPGTLPENSTFYVFCNFSANPAAPQNLELFPGDGKIKLMWEVSSGEWGQGGESFKAVDVITAGFYNIYRSTELPENPGSYRLLASTPGYCSSYTDTGLNNYTTYYYYLRAADPFSETSKEGQGRSNIGAYKGTFPRNKYIRVRIKADLRDFNKEYYAYKKDS